MKKKYFDIYLLIFFFVFLSPVYFLRTEEALFLKKMDAQAFFFDRGVYFKEAFKKEGVFKEQLALCYLDQNQFQLAKELFQSPKTKEQYWIVSFCLRRLGCLQEAIDLLESSPWKDQKELQMELAASYFIAGKKDQAKEILQRLKLEEAKLLLAVFAIEEEDIEQAEIFLKELSENQKTPLLQGILDEKRGSYESAATSFKKGLKQEGISLKLAFCYLHLAEDIKIPREKRARYLEEGQKLIALHFLDSPHFNVSLAKTFMALLKQRLVKVPSSSEALPLKDSLSSLENFSINQKLLQLFQVELAPTFEDRKNARKTTLLDPDLLAIGLFLEGLDAKELADVHLEKREEFLNQAYFSFKRASELLPTSDPKLARLALELLTEVLFCHPSPLNSLFAFQILDPQIEKLADEKEDFLVYQYGQIAFFTARLINSQTIRERAFYYLQNMKQASQSSLIQDRIGTLLAKEAQLEGNYLQSLSFWQEIEKSTKDPLLRQEALFFSSFCLEQLQTDPKKVKQLRQSLIEQFPNSSFASEAAFRLYTPSEYLQGDKSALKSLKAFPSLYPKSPFLISAWFLIGLDSKRDRKSLEGKWLSKKNLSLAIDAFQKAESCFDLLEREAKIPQHHYTYFKQIKERCTLERALANLTIGQESTGGKRKIYLEYAEDLFKRIIRELKIEEENQERELLLFQESLFRLAQVYYHQDKPKEAKRTFLELTSLPPSLHLSKSVFFAKAWYELAKLNLKEGENQAALLHFSKAEEAASKAQLFSQELWLHLWIQKSLACQKLGQLDEAMLLLSQVINQDVASALRLEAMYLRAELLATQGKGELAKKQWIALSKKGGTWGLAAQKKLKEIYGDESFNLQ